MSSDLRYQPPSAEVADISAEEQLSGTLNPWFSMWLRPRATIRQIVASNPERLIIAVSMLIGIIQVLDRASGRSLGDSVPFGAILAIAFVIGPLSGLIGIYLYAWLVSWPGRMLGGHAPLLHIRAALVWGCVPSLWASLSWIPALLFLQHDMFTTETPRVEASMTLLLLLLGVGITQLVGGFWSIVSLCKALGEVQGFSAWRALGNTILAALVVIVPIAIIAVAVIVVNKA